MENSEAKRQHENPDGEQGNPSYGTSPASGDEALASTEGQEYIILAAHREEWLEKYHGQYVVILDHSYCIYPTLERLSDEAVEFFKGGPPLISRIDGRSFQRMLGG